MTLHFERKIYKWLLPVFAAGLMVFVSQCKPDDKGNPTPDEPWADAKYEFKTPPRFPQYIENINNPLTVNGVALGRKLFYETKLSGNNTQACASCHKQEFSFSDAPNALSEGIDGMVGDKNSMALINLAWNNDFFWDGRRHSLEEQALDPVRNPVEMHESWKAAITKLQADTAYPPLFKKAFNTETVDSLLVAKAITQFIKTIVASNSKLQKDFTPSFATLSPSEKRGFEIFKSEDGGDCFHCHPITGMIFTDNYFDNPVQRFHNNGLDPAPPAGTLTGHARVTNSASDNGKFKAPTLLNVELTAPYMHDGRFKTLEDVVEFYNSGVNLSSTLDPNMNIKPTAFRREFVDGKRLLHLTDQEKADLVAFLKTLTDLSVTTNPAYSKP
jgi:cytochrome c peroxidase